MRALICVEVNAVGLCRGTVLHIAAHNAALEVVALILVRVLIIVAQDLVFIVAAHVGGLEVGQVLFLSVYNNRACRMIDFNIRFLVVQRYREQEAETRSAVFLNASDKVRCLIELQIIAAFLGGACYGVDLAFPLGDSEGDAESVVGVCVVGYKNEAAVLNDGIIPFNGAAVVTAAVVAAGAFVAI